MLASSRLSCRLLDYPDQVSFPGLQNAIVGGQPEGLSGTHATLSGTHATHERVLDLAARVSRAAGSRQVPLPPAFMMMLANPDAPIDASDMLLEGQGRHVPVPAGGPIGRVLSGNMSSLSLLPADVARPVTEHVEVPVLTRGYSSSAIEFIKKISSPRKESLLGVGPSLTGATQPLTGSARSSTVAVPVDGSWYGNGVVQQGDVVDLSTRQSSLRVPPLTSASKSAVGLSALPSVIIPSSTWPIEASGTAGSQSMDASGTRRIKTALGAAIGSVTSPSSQLPLPQLMKIMPHHGAVAVFPDQGLSSALAATYHIPSKWQDLQQQAVPPVAGMVTRRPQGRRLYHQGGVVAMPTTSMPMTGDGDPEGMPGASPQVVNLTGGVTVDGRRLGRLTASSQAREASLPARGPSRVNLRTVPIYSGMQIPS